MALDPAQLALLASLSDDTLADDSPIEQGSQGDADAQRRWEVLRDVTSDVCDVEAETLTPHARLVDDLDMDDLIRYTVITRCERELHVHARDRDVDAAETLGDLDACLA